MLRDVNCGELRVKDSGKVVKIAGWVKRIRDHGEIIFIDLWDRYGITQIVFPEEDLTRRKKARELGLEWVIMVLGEVKKRPKDMINPKIPTGEIEVQARELSVLNSSKVPPFVVKEDLQAEKELKLKYRYLELRRDKALRNFILRHKLMQSARKFLNERGFLEVETPILATPTPEGARDFLVPSRMHPGCFYSLAQSPQLYKQILMVSGFDRYYQFARCFRDEDMRGDRQLEHTQIDIEMAYPEREDIYGLGEGLLTSLLEEEVGVKPSIPFPKMRWEEVMDKYGTDKPDLRNPLIIQDYTREAKNGNFGIFNSSKSIKGVKVKSLFTRRDIGELEKIVKKVGAKGLLYLMNDGGEYRSPFAKYFDDLKGFKIQKGETLFLVAGSRKIILPSLGALRIKLGKKLGLLEKAWSFLWVTDFPIFEWKEDENRWVSTHHIFTQPIGDIESIEDDPGSVLGKQYDLVLNGVELGSGSIRNHNPEVQLRLLKVLGMNDEEIQGKFGFLLNALSHGAPPHGGIALGFDRICMLLAGFDSITEVITFPKTLSGVGLMEGSPSEVPGEDLKELKLEVKNNE
ncbi:MAG: aspartate--tRNA ligase [candidate division WOR-3 bacterium]|nr:aspartate--tRNA ligase [candidate division WOR-3 bacterium]